MAAILSPAQASVMASKYKISFPGRIFALLLFTIAIMVVCFMGFQYAREKRYKAERFDAELQQYNHHLLDAIESGRPLSEVVAASHKPMPDMRISVIDASGAIVYDSSLENLPRDNHLQRPEIADAFHSGHGCSISRQSASTGTTYFYSATKGSDIVIRSAVPYSVGLSDILAADRTFLWFMLTVAIIVSILGYLAARRIGQTIARLNKFALQAESGEQIYNTEAFPHDELGDIAGHIVRLYVKLQQSNADRDQQHRIALHQEQEKIRIKKELTNNINHELKTPVAAMSVCLETLEAHPDLTPAQRQEFLKRCAQNCARLDSLLRDVSIITRMDDGPMAITREPVDLAVIIKEAVSDCTLQAEKNGLIIINRVEAPLPMEGNSALLLSVFRNLIDNAAAYSGGSIVEIKLTMATDQTIALTVADNGVGVPEEHLQRIFERFYRIDKGRSRAAGGTGLGLSIVRNAIAMHGGSIAAENRPSGGLMHRIILQRRFDSSVVR